MTSTRRCPASSPTHRRVPFAHDARGAVFLEYIAVVAFVGLVLTAMLVTLGPPVVREYSGRRALLYSHSP